MQPSTSSGVAIAIALISLAGVIVTGIFTYAGGEFAATNLKIEATNTAEARLTAAAADAHDSGSPSDDETEPASSPTPLNLSSEGSAAASSASEAARPAVTLTPAPTATPTPTSQLQPTTTQALSPEATTITLPTIQAVPSPTPILAGKDGATCVQAEGTGFARQTETDSLKRQRTALQAAEIDAKRRLAEWANGADIDAVTIMSDGEIVTDTVKLTVKARITGAETIAKSYDEATGMATVVVAVCDPSLSQP